MTLIHLSFLHSFVTDLSRPIEKSEHSHIEYIPNQVVTEYVHFMMRKNQPIDGIIYQSAKNSERCAVLFYDQEECLENLKFQSELTSSGIV